ncbi:MAG: esterase/lipase superfamily enzyme [Mariniblastus sp.]
MALPGLPNQPILRTNRLTLNPALLFTPALTVRPEPRAMNKYSQPINLWMIAGLISLCLATSGCGVFRKTTRVLMPTPICISAGLPHPGGDFLEPCGCSDDELPVFVISGRNVLSDPDGLNPFGIKRTHQLTTGVAYVKIGEGLTAEQLHRETTTDIKQKKAKVEFSRIELDPMTDEAEPWCVGNDVAGYGHHQFVQAIRDQLEKTGSRQATIFVHGYNTEFIDNTLLAGEIFHYLGRRGAMISFEWPSESRLLGYVADKGNASYSTRHFRAIIANLAKECDVESITIVAHSAGSPIVVNALRELRLLDFDQTAKELQAKYRIRRVVLAAPDMDMMAFINAVKDRFHDIAGQVAVYASPNDRALRASEIIYGNNRLGRSVGKVADWEREALSQIPQIELIDASVAENVYRNFTGHSYFHRDPWVSSDIGAFILGLDPESRGLVPAEDTLFWEFPTDYPARLKAKASQSLSFDSTF